MTAYGFKNVPGTMKWNVFRAVVKSIRGAKKWAARNGLERVFIPAHNAGDIWGDDSVGFVKIDGKYIKEERCPYLAIPLCFTVYTPHGLADSHKKTLAALQEYARDYGA